MPRPSSASLPWVVLANTTSARKAVFVYSTLARKWLGKFTCHWGRESFPGKDSRPQWHVNSLTLFLSRQRTGACSVRRFQLISLGHGTLFFFPCMLLIKADD